MANASRSSWIALAALIVSIISAGSSAFSSFNAKQSLELTQKRSAADELARKDQIDVQVERDRVERRAELRGLVLRLGAIPRDMTEAQFRARAPTPENGAYLAAVAGALNLEGAALAGRAYDLILVMNAQREPVSSGELLIVAQILQNSADWVRADRLLVMADDAAEETCSPIDFAMAMKQRAIQSMRLGDFAGGRSQFGSALAAFSRKPCMATAARMEVDTVLATLYTNWAAAEFETGHCPEAKARLDEARTAVDGKYPTAVISGYIQSASFLRAVVDRSCK